MNNEPLKMLKVSLHHRDISKQMHVQHLKSVAETLVDAAQTLSELLLCASVCALVHVAIL